jgi:hypothetical protein
MELSRRFDGKKFMWDGETRADESKAREAAIKYETAGFRAETVSEESAFYVFTRREVREAVAEGQS